MDTSPEYIKMCSQAKEIQEGHQLDEGDFYSPDGKAGDVFCDEFQEDGIWLPRQDQLQEMIGSYLDCVQALNKMHYNFANSMEQLWLAFVMKERYQKVWNGEEWI